MEMKVETRFLSHLSNVMNMYLVLRINLQIVRGRTNVCSTELSIAFMP